MNEKLEETVNTILQNAISAASQGTEFLKDQIPDVLRQLLLWKTVENLLCGAFFALCALAIYKTGRYLWRKKFEFKGASYENDWDFPAMAFTLFGGFGGVACAIMAFISLLDAVEIIFAPKVWLLEYAAHLVHH